MNTLPGRLVLLGHPLGHSLSPRLQNAALRKAGIPLTYETLDVQRRVLDDTIVALRQARGAGNVTIPYKEAIASSCDRITDTARAAGAVNTFWMAVDHAMVGDNTDVPGFDAAARALLGSVPTGARIALFGAGGGAAAVLHAMEGWQPSAIRVYSRTPERAEHLVTRFALPATVVESAEDAVKHAAIVVNATPVGMQDDESPVAVSALPNGCAVLDLVYRRGETAFVRAARARGLRAQDGLTMLVEQGALAFERWFGVTPDREAMWAAVKDLR